MNLQTIIEQLQSSQPGLAFDIDDTLSLTSDGFYDLLHPQFPAPSNLTKEHFRKHYALTGEALHWKSIQEAYDLIKKKGDENQFHYELSPFPDAIAQTNILHNHHLFGCYLTARPENMYDMTTRWLQEHNFPQKPLLMRPMDIDFVSKHKEWKTTLLHTIHPHIIGLIDNDTRILSHLQQQSYPGHLYLFGLSQQEYDGNGSITVRETWTEMTKEILNNNNNNN